MKHLMAILSVLVLGLGATFSNAAEPVSGAAAAAKAETVTKQDEAKQTVAKQGAVNINTADVAELTKLKGIGVKKAEAIVAWRTANGGFKSLDQLLDVKGIGEATLMANRENIRI